LTLIISSIDLIATRRGVKPTTSQPQVQHPNPYATKPPALRLHSDKHKYEFGFPFMARRSFTRMSGVFTVTYTSTKLNACRPY